MKSADNPSLLRSRGWGPLREEWYSICCFSPGHKKNCPRCHTGHWVNVWRQRIEHLHYKFFPAHWRRMANRPDSEQRRRIESVFPGLKRKP